MSGAHHFLTEAQYGDSLVHRLDPRVKIMGLMGLTVVSVSTPADAVWAFASYLGVLLFLLGLSRLPLVLVLRRVALVLPFILMVAVFLPFFGRAGGGGYNVGSVRISGAGLLVLWNVTAKATVGVTAMTLLASTTSFPELVAGLERLRTPRLFTLIVSFMYRYSFLFVEEFRRMRRAMEARNFQGRWLWQAGIVGHMVSSLFLRSYQRGERVYLAMVSRGYDGSMRASAPLALRRADAAFITGLATVLLAVRITA
ncbi:MAG: cobalt ECF transporter T component CbiQ [Thermoleophilia bacterium]|nr:cobalt ECF transporter T component CbiQ [Thermoleophilia bacterium]